MAARRPPDWHHDPGHVIVREAFRIASHTDTRARPIHLIQALAERDGPFADALHPIRPTPSSDTARPRGGGSTYLLGQAQLAAADFAATRGEPLDAPHLLLALLDQGDPETQHALADAGIDTASLRRHALQSLDAPLDLAPIPMPPLTPAGTLDRPPLPVEELDPRAWRVLSWRQQHLPLDHVHSVSDVDALAALEQRAAWRIADRAGVTDDQRYSLLSHHRIEVEHHLTPTDPPLTSTPVRPSPAGILSATRRRPLRRHRWVPNFMVGWPTWFGNRRADLRNRRFQITTRSTYRDQPPLDS